VRAQVGSRRLTGWKTAKRARAESLAQRPIGPLLAQQAEAVVCFHDASDEGLRAPRAMLEIEGREIVRRREDALMACDPAPWCSQTPTTAGMQSNAG
jgi:hypothetical protein